jgi:superfamily I DNA and/or RNA helicase
MDVLVAIQDAKQVVLVGDHKQLGPIYTSSVEGYENMFWRLVEAGHPFTMLDV